MTFTISLGGVALVGSGAEKDKVPVSRIILPKVRASVQKLGSFRLCFHALDSKDCNLAPPFVSSETPAP